MQVTKNDDFVETYENTTGEFDTIFEMTTPDKKNFRLKDGTLLVLDLRDSSDDKIEGSAKLQIGGQKPTQRYPREIDEKSYRPYNQISLDNQYNSDNQSELLIDVDPGRIDFIEGHKMVIDLKADNEVDWNNSTIEFEVEEKAYRDK